MKKLGRQAQISGNLENAGNIYVDSGQIMVVCEKSRKTKWLDEEFVCERHYNFVDAGIVLSFPYHFTNYETTLQEAYMKYILEDTEKRKILIEKRSSVIAKHADKTINQINSEGLLKKIEREPTKKFSYDGSCSATLANFQAGILELSNGDGVSVTFSTRHGDGCYDVFLEEVDGEQIRIIVDFGYTDDEDYINGRKTRYTIMGDLYKIGTFKIDGDEIYITDPCYDYPSIGTSTINLTGKNRELTAYKQEDEDGCVKRIVIELQKPDHNKFLQIF